MEVGVAERVDGNMDGEGVRDVMVGDRMVSADVSMDGEEVRGVMVGDRAEGVGMDGMENNVVELEVVTEQEMDREVEGGGVGQPGAGRRPATGTPGGSRRRAASALHPLDRSSRPRGGQHWAWCPAAGRRSRGTGARAGDAAGPGSTRASPWGPTRGARLGPP